MFASETGRISTWKTRLLEFSQVGASATSTRGEASAWQSYRDLESRWRRHRTYCDKGVLSSNNFSHRKRPTRSRAKRVPKFKLSLTKKKGHFLVGPKLVRRASRKSFRSQFIDFEAPGATRESHEPLPASTLLLSLFFIKTTGSFLVYVRENVILMALGRESKQITKLFTLSQRLQKCLIPRPSLILVPPHEPT